MGDQLQYADFRALGRHQPARVPDIAMGAGLWRLHHGELQGYSLQSSCSASVDTNELSSALDYHLGNRQAAQGSLPLLNIPGSRLHQRAVADWKCRVATSAYVGTDIFIGKHCQVGRLARLEENCVLSNGVIIDRGTRLRNVSVLPNTFVGRNASIRDAIIGPAGYIGFDGRFTAVADPAVIGSTRDSRERLTGIPEQGLAACWSSG